MKMRLREKLVVGSVLLLLLGVGCSEEQDAKGQHLKLAGSTTVEPVALTAGKDFMDQNPGVEVRVRGGGSTIGVKGVGYGALSIGMASRPIKPEELEKWPNLTTTAVGRDGVAVVVNKELYNAGVKQLTLEQVASIWLGKTTNWREVGGPDLTIVAFDKEMGRGTRDTFGKAVLGGEKIAAPGTSGALGENEAVLAAVSGNKAAVSILSTGWQTAEVVGVAIVGKDGQAVAPTAEAVAAGRYAISRDLVVITDGPPRGTAKEFIDFLLSPAGQTHVEKQGYTAVSSKGSLAATKSSGSTAR